MTRAEHVLSDPERVRERWVLLCSCAWLSEPYTRAEQARAAGALHMLDVLNASTPSEQRTPPAARSTGAGRPRGA